MASEKKAEHKVLLYYKKRDAATFEQVSAGSY